MGKGRGRDATSTIARERMTLGLPFGGGIVSRNEDERNPSGVMSVDLIEGCGVREGGGSIGVGREFEDIFYYRISTTKGVMRG
jgi:hypothetical protein